jgi:hypothetical protein
MKIKKIKGTTNENEQTALSRRIGCNDCDDAGDDDTGSFAEQQSRADNEPCAFKALRGAELLVHLGGAEL